MATLSATMGFKYTNGTGNQISAVTIPPKTKDYTITANTKVSNTQAVGFAAHEALILGEVGTPGYGWFTNTDSTNFVEIGIDEAATFHPFAKLLAGQTAMVPLSEAPYAQADTGSVNLDYTIFGV